MEQFLPLVIKIFPQDRAHQWFVEQVLLVFKALSWDRVQQRLLVEVLKALSQDRVRPGIQVRQSPQDLVLRPSGDEEEDEEDEDLDEMDVTQSRFPAGFQPMRMCRWFGWRCLFAHWASELHPQARLS